MRKAFLASKLRPVDAFMLAVVADSDESCTVLQAMSLAADQVSSTTAHRSLKSLRLAGYITLQGDPHDTRIKYVIPTAKAHKFIAMCKGGTNG